MLASVVSAEVFDVLRDQPPHEIERVRAALAALPESWEAQRVAAPEDRHTNRAERRANARKRPR
jgi:cytochrome c556